MNWGSLMSGAHGGFANAISGAAGQMGDVAMSNQKAAMHAREMDSMARVAEAKNGGGGGDMRGMGGMGGGSPMGGPSKFSMLFKALIGSPEESRSGIDMYGHSVTVPNYSPLMEALIRSIGNPQQNTTSMTMNSNLTPGQNLNPWRV